MPTPRDLFENIDAYQGDPFLAELRRTEQLLDDYRAYYPDFGLTVTEAEAFIARVHRNLIVFECAVLHSWLHP